MPASDEEEGAVLFDNSGKAAADPFDTSSGSVQLIGIKPTALPVVHPTSDRSQEPAALNGEVSTRGPEREKAGAARPLGIRAKEQPLGELGAGCIWAAGSFLSVHSRASAELIKAQVTPNHFVG